MTNLNKGLIYKTLDYKESSKLLFLYTPRGKITLVAHGVKSLKHEYRVLSQYLTEIEFEDKGKEMFSLSKAKTICAFDSVKSNFTQMKQAALPLEIIDHLLTEDLPHDKIYDLLIQLLKTDTVTASLVFPLKMLYLLGYGLDFVGHDPIGFSVKEATVSTKENQFYPDTNLETTVLLSKLYFYKITDKVEIDSKQILDVLTFIKAFYRYHLEYDFKSLRE